ncbi:unnamed protein product [Soboliphyme baturini]|uniref:N-terminal methionine N(alpha)-acetyltransferase NatE n=1 Tax=Soboliphyme baturini TaxID=241478 RepID=A0A183ILV1_9BILA|nr:unnamed protein product [Soboliphyme baturini]
MILSSARLELGDITHHNVKQLKRINQIVFPVSYNDRFYKDILEANQLAKFAYFNDIVVGAVCCRVSVTDGHRKMYIMTLGCLPAYRRLGLGLHVQINNEGALEFYKKFDFKVVEMAHNYYKRIEPADAYVLEKRLHEPVIVTDKTKDVKL